MRQRLAERILNGMRKLLQIPASVPLIILLLAGVEFFERSSFYGLRGLIPAYLEQVLHYSSDEANRILGNYKGLVYLSPLIGALLADLFWGQRKAIIVGGVLMMFGHFVLGFNGAMLMGLCLMVAGNGCFKPNVSTMVDGQYPPDQKDRTTEGYQVFYQGINLGALFGPLVCSYVGEKISWHLGFALAGFGMAIGLVWFWRSWRYLAPVGFPPNRKEATFTRRDVFGIVGIVVLVLGLCAWFVSTFTQPIELGPTAESLALLSGPRAQTLIDITQAAAPALAIVWLASVLVRSRRKGSATYLPPKDRRRLLLLVVVVVMTSMMWTVFEMADTIVGEITRNHMDRVVGSFEVPTGWFSQSLNPLFIVLLTPVMLRVWRWYDTTANRTNSILRGGIGLLFSVGACLVMWVATRHLTQLQTVDKQALLSPVWVVTFTLLSTIAELCISPLGLALVAKLSVERLQSRMMAIFFLTSSIGGYLSGNLKRLLVGVNALTGWNLTLWPFLTTLALGIALCTIVLSKRLSRLGGEEE